MTNDTDLILLIQQGRALELSLDEAVNEPKADKTFNFTMVMDAVQKYCGAVKKIIPTLNMDQKLLLSNIVVNILDFTTILEQRIQGVIDTETAKKSTTTQATIKASTIQQAYQKKTKKRF